MDRDRSLLFSLMAVQLNMATPADLIDATFEHRVSAGDDLGERLVECAVLTPRDCSLLKSFVEQAIAAHEGDCAATLEDLGGERAVEEIFRGSLVFGESGAVKAVHPVEQGQRLASEGVISRHKGNSSRYKTIRELARGGIGRVLLSYDSQFNRHVAVKELLKGASGKTAQDGKTSDATRIERFLREARITGRLEHPSIVPVYEMGARDDGTPYYAMKLVRGRTLEKAVGDSKTLQERLTLLSHFNDLCQGIAYAHSKGVIHRDIKPSNVMVGEFGETVVIDWGLAKPKHAAWEGEPSEDNGPDAPDEGSLAHLEDGLTREGQVIGTPQYMSPEQAMGRLEDVDERSDVYALGAVLHFIIAGTAPFDGSDPREILRHVIHSTPAPVTAVASGAPPELAAICQRALAKESARRYQSAKELAEEVSRFQTGALVSAHHYKIVDHIVRTLRRNKALVLTGAAAAAVLLVTAVVSYIQILDARDREREQRLAAESANEGLVWENYSATLAVVQQHLTEGNRLRALEVLNSSAVEHRDWEWGWLRQRYDHVIWTLDDENIPESLYGTIGRAFLSPNDRYVLRTRIYHNRVDIFDLKQGKLVAHTTIGPWGGYRGAAGFTPDSQGFFAPLDDHRVGRWTLDSERPEVIYDSGQGDIRALTISGDDSLAAGLVVGENRQVAIYIWDASSGAILNRHVANTLRPDLPWKAGQTRPDWYSDGLAGEFIRFFKDNRRIVFTDSEIAVMNVTTGETRRDYTGVGFEASFSEATSRLVVSSQDGRIEAWDLESHEPLYLSDETHEHLLRLAIRPDGERFACMKCFSEWHEWSAQVINIGLGMSISNHEFAASEFAYSSNGKVLIGRDETRQLTQFLDPSVPPRNERVRFKNETGEPISEIIRQTENVRPATDFDSSKTRMATGNFEGQVSVWEVPAFRRVARFDAHSKFVKYVEFSPDGKTLATVDADSVQLWNLESKASTLTIPRGDLVELYACAFSPDGSRLAVCGGDPRDKNAPLDEAWVVDAVTGQRLFTLEGHEGPLHFVDFSPDGMWLFTGSNAATEGRQRVSLKIWDAETGSELQGVIYDINWPWQIEFSPDNKSMLVLGLGLEPVLWDFDSMTEVYRVSGADAHAISFHPSGNRFAIVTTRRRVKIHAVSDGRELLTIGDGQFPLTFTADGRNLIAGFDNEHMQIFRTSDWMKVEGGSEWAKGLQKLNELLSMTGSPLESSTRFE